MSKPNGYILYQGPSLLDGEPIVTLATGFTTPSRNEKTGPMIQTWILHGTLPPREAVSSGADAAICGDCRHRGTSCYVQVDMGVTNLWSAAVRGAYPVLNPSHLSLTGRGRDIRLGAYGDPAAVPVAIWQHFVRQAASHTGYTHQWRQPRFAALKALCMASGDSEDERIEAQALDWRTFRVRERGSRLGVYEIDCPASAAIGKKTDCISCRACGGLEARAKVDISIEVHGGSVQMGAFERGGKI